MLTALRLESYKGFRKAVDVPLAPITVLLGKNNSGKSAFARVPILLFEVLSRTEHSRTPVPLSVRGVRIGGSPDDFISDGMPHGSCTVGVGYATTRSETFEVDLCLQSQQELGRHGWLSLKSLHAVSKGLHDYEFDLVPESASPGFNRGIFSWPFESDVEATIHQVWTRATSVNSTIMHLTAHRSALESLYSHEDQTQLYDATGSAAPNMLATNSRIAAQVSNWYEKTLGVSLVVSGGSDAFSIRTGRGAARVNLAMSGQGYQQVLPVITYLCGLGEWDYPYSTLILEEPELHLHPAVHPAIADLIIDAVASPAGRQVIIETHSENLVLRLRRAVAEGRLAPENLSILWFDAEAEGGVRPVGVNGDGSVSEWPSGVFSEDLEEVRAILRGGSHAR